MQYLLNVVGAVSFMLVMSFCILMLIAGRKATQTERIVSVRIVEVIEDANSKADLPYRQNAI